MLDVGLGCLFPSFSFHQLDCQRQIALGELAEKDPGLDLVFHTSLEAANVGSRTSSRQKIGIFLPYSIFSFLCFPLLHQHHPSLCRHREGEDNQAIFHLQSKRQLSLWLHIPNNTKIAQFPLNALQKTTAISHLWLLASSLPVIFTQGPSRHVWKSINRYSSDMELLFPLLSLSDQPLGTALRGIWGCCGVSASLAAHYCHSAAPSLVLFPT